MKVRIIPAYIGWAALSEEVRGPQLYYKAACGFNRITDRQFNYANLKQKILFSKFTKGVMTMNPKMRNYKFRNYLQSRKEKIWILDRVIKELIDRLDYAYCYDEIEQGDINYYVNWHSFKKKSQGIDVAFFTHFDDKEKDDFISIAKQVDYAVCMSKKYKEILQEYGASNVSVISVGVDTEFFIPKLILGYAGGLYSNRKGLDLLNSLKQLDWIELRLTHGKLPFNELPNFYRQLDYVIVPSLYEGGPMCLMEGLACGIPIIAPRDVGAVSEYDKGIIHYERGNFHSLKSVLGQLYERKLQLRRQVQNQTWDNFAQEHDKLFKELIINRKDKR